MNKNLDGWQNVLVNLGNSNDPNQHSYFKDKGRIPYSILEDLYRSDGIARRIVDVITDDALRPWLSCEPELQNEFKRLKIKENLTNLSKWSRLFGGAVCVLFCDDSKDFSDPLKIESNRKILQLRVYERSKVSYTHQDLDDDPYSENFGMPKFYSIYPANGGVYKVHYTRTYRLDGLDLPTNERIKNEGWGESVLQPVYESLKTYGMISQASANILRDFIQVVIGIKGLTDMIRDGEDDLVTQRAKLIDMTRSVANSIFLDADGETYSKQASSVSGLSDLWDRFALNVCSATGIPATKLLGRAPNGLNATGESDIRNYYDMVESYRQDTLDPFISWIIKIIAAQTQLKFKPYHFEYIWNSIWQMSENEKADLKLKLAQVDSAYIDRGAADGEFLYHLRYGQKDFDPNVCYTKQNYEEWVKEMQDTPKENEVKEMIDTPKENESE